MKVGIEKVAHTSNYEYEDPSSLQLHEQDPEPALPRTIPKLLDIREQRTMLQKMSPKEAKLIYTSRVRALKPKAAEVAHFDALQTGFESDSDDLNYASFHFVV